MEDIVADNSLVFPQWFLDEFDKLYEKLEVSERHPSYKSGDIGHSNHETRDHDVQLNSSFENDKNVSESCFSPETRNFSNPTTSLGFQCHRYSHQTSNSNSLVAQYSNCDSSERSNVFIVPVDKPQRDFFRKDDNQLNHSENISSQNNNGWNNWKHVPQDILENKSFCTDVSEVLQTDSSLGTVETPQGVFGWTDNNRSVPSDNFHSQNNIGWSNWSPVPHYTNFVADTSVASEMRHTSSSLAKVQTPQSDFVSTYNNQYNPFEEFSTQSNEMGNSRSLPQDILKNTSFASDTSEVSGKSPIKSSLAPIGTQQLDFCCINDDLTNRYKSISSQNTVRGSNWGHLLPKPFKNQSFGATISVAYEKNNSFSLAKVQTPQSDFVSTDNNQYNAFEEFSTQSNKMGASRSLPQDIHKNTSFAADNSEVSGKSPIKSSLVPVEAPKLDICWRYNDLSNKPKHFSSLNTVRWSNWGHFLPKTFENMKFGAYISEASEKNNIIFSLVQGEKPQNDFCWRDDNQQYRNEHIISQNNIGNNWMPVPKNMCINSSFGANNSSCQDNNTESGEFSPESELNHLDSTSPSEMSTEGDLHEATEQKEEDYREISTESKIFSRVDDIPNIEMATDRLSLDSIANCGTEPSRIQTQSCRTRKVKQFLCEFCGKTFTRSFSVKVYRSTHTGAKPYACNTCGKRFTYLSALKLHHFGHSGAWPYTCSECDRKFVYKNKLDRHLRTHTKEKLFICDVCNKGFSLKGNLKVHHQTHALTPHICELCGKSLSGKKNLIWHQKILHKRN